MTTQLTLLPPSSVSAPPRRRHAGSLDVLHPSEERVLDALGRYYYLTPGQLKRLLYAPGSHRRAYEVVRRLTARGYIDRYPFFPAVTAPTMATLSTKGRQYLASREAPTRTRYRPAEVRAQSTVFYYHLEAVNDVLISAAQLSADVPAITLFDWLHDYDLKKISLKVTVDGRERAVIYDAWLDFRVRTAQGVQRSCVALELDRGTTKQAAFRRKIRALLAVTPAAYQAAFGAISVTYAFVATGGPAHAARLRGWIERELQHAQARDRAELFWVTSEHPAGLAPATFWCAPHWRCPFEPSPAPLFADLV